MSEDVEILLNGEYVCTKQLSDDEVQEMLDEPDAFKVRFPVTDVEETFKAVMTQTKLGLTLNMERIH